MKTLRELYSERTVMCTCELNCCPICQGRMRIAYVSGPKLVQTLSGTIGVAHLPKRCIQPGCAGSLQKWGSAYWQQIAPKFCTYGYDVIAQVGWLRQNSKEQFAAIQAGLAKRIHISETQVRRLYHERYLPLLACHERRFENQLHEIAQHSGLILSLDGLASEGGEAQLWVVRELTSGLTLRSGWLARQDETVNDNYIYPWRQLEMPMMVVIVWFRRWGWFSHRPNIAFAKFTILAMPLNLWQKRMKP